MVLAGQDTPCRPTPPTAAIALLRARLILEEALETCQALGVSVFFDGHVHGETLTMKPMSSLGSIPTIGFAVTGTPNLVEIADGCADISVVTTGTLVACGIADKELLELVDNNNLSKFGPGHYKDDFGKLVKPPGHKPPDIAGLLNRQGSIF